MAALVRLDQVGACVAAIATTLVAGRARKRRADLDGVTRHLEGMASTAHPPTGRTWTFTGTQSIRGHAMRGRTNAKRVRAGRTTRRPSFASCRATLVKLRTELVIAKKPLNIDETSSFDPATARWTTLTQGNAYRGVATPWLANTWIFDGTVPRGDRRAPVRMVDATLGANAFRREHQRPDGDVWKTLQSETCRRT